MLCLFDGGMSGTTLVFVVVSSAPLMIVLPSLSSSDSISWYCEGWLGGEGVGGCGDVWVVDD